MQGGNEFGLPRRTLDGAGTGLWLAALMLIAPVFPQRGTIDRGQRPARDAAAAAGAKKSVHCGKPGIKYG